MTTSQTLAPAAPRWRIGIALLAVLVLLAAGATAYVAMRPGPRSHLPSISKDGAFHVGSLPDKTGEAVVAAAVAAMPDALSYDYRHLPQGLARATSHMTKSFGARFASTFDKTAAAQATPQQAIANALVRGAGLVSRHGDHAQCLVYVNQVLVSSKTMALKKTPVRLTQSRVLVGLVQQHGAWLVDSIEPL